MTKTLTPNASTILVYVSVAGKGWVTPFSLLRTEAGVFEQSWMLNDVEKVE